MEEKFDEEFKRKVKGINPEIPEIVKMRIEETLASLPGGKKSIRHIYSIAAAALILICITGLGYKSLVSPKRVGMNKGAEQIQLAANNAPTAGKQNGTIGIQAADSGDSARKDDSSNNSEKDSNYDAKVPGNTTGKRASDGAAIGTTTVQTANAPEGLQKSTNNGVDVELKSVSYDGQQIKVQFVKSGSDNNTVKSLVKVEEKYDMDITINSIPLKCSINLKDAPSSLNQYTGELVITPESSLPDEFEMGVLFKQLGDISGQWEVYAHIKKDTGN